MDDDLADIPPPPSSSQDDWDLFETFTSEDLTEKESLEIHQNRKRIARTQAAESAAPGSPAVGPVRARFSPLTHRVKKSLAATGRARLRRFYIVQGADIGTDATEVVLTSAVPFLRRLCWAALGEGHPLSLSSRPERQAAYQAVFQAITTLFKDFLVEEKSSLSKIVRSHIQKAVKEVLGDLRLGASVQDKVKALEARFPQVEAVAQVVKLKYLTDAKMDCEKIRPVYFEVCSAELGGQRGLVSFPGDAASSADALVARANNAERIRTLEAENLRLKDELEHEKEVVGRLTTEIIRLNATNDGLQLALKLVHRREE